MRPLIRSILAMVLVSQLGACAALVVGGAAATGMAIHDRRSFGTVVDDNVLEIRIREALFRQDDFDSELRIKIKSHNGWVLLAGEVLSEDRIIRAEQIAGDIEGVHRLFNELSPLERAGPGMATSDKWVSTRVNGSLTRIRDLPGFDATRVKVTTTRGIVYLMGLVSREEAEAVIDRARTVRGVERVVTLFEYLDEAT